MFDKIEQESNYWVVYRHSDTWGDCPLYKTKDKELAKWAFSV